MTNLNKEDINIASGDYVRCIEPIEDLTVWKKYRVDITPDSSLGVIDDVGDIRIIRYIDSTCLVPWFEKVDPKKMFTFEDMLKAQRELDGHKKIVLSPKCSGIKSYCEIDDDCIKISKHGSVHITQEEGIALRDFLNQLFPSEV